MSHGSRQRAALRLRSQALLAGAGSTVALVGAVIAVALVGAGLVAFDAWPSPDRRPPAAPLSLAPVGPTAPGVTVAVATADADAPAVTAAPTGDGPSAPARTVQEALAPVTPSVGAPLGPAPAGPTRPGTAAPPATGGPPAPEPGAIAATGQEAGTSVADAGDAVGAALGGEAGTVVRTVTEGAAELIHDTTAALGAALQRPPG